MRRLVLLVIAFAALGSGTAEAHGIGQRYDLPVPLWLYLYGAAAAVVVSFILVGIFVGARTGPARYPRYDLLRTPVIGSVLRSQAAAALVQALGVALFALVLATSLFGTENPIANFTPTFVWVIWWVGLFFFTALVGDLWRLLNPWRTLFVLGDRLARALGRRAGLDLGHLYPLEWGSWPAVLLYAGFVWIEVVYAGAPEPRAIGVLVLLYSALTWGGVAAFGAEEWLRRADPFTVLFGVVARFAPTEIRVRDRAVCAECEACIDTSECVGCYECWAAAPVAKRELALRPWGAGLLRPVALGPGGVAFVVLMLATVSFDGLAVTGAWGRLGDALMPFVIALRVPRQELVGTVGLPAVGLVFFLAYYLITRTVAAHLERPGARVAEAFVLSLVPIALAYHAAHYYTLFLGYAPTIVPLLSDPFGWGWDLLGVRRTVTPEVVLNAAFVWYSQVALIVAGHAGAVYLGHRIALQVAPSARAALHSQRPMLGLMVLYTVLSLWILAQPVVSETRL
ncbi:MAG TPA: hypothetical protein VFC31_12885 [Candidatus Limnocylindria bacterium]|nr:hypothetical protein [Candidatus Limnocylindria bacterium]